VSLLARGWLAVCLAVAGGAVAAPSTGVLLPSEALNKHLGVATCSSSVCHGSVTPNQTYDVLLNEYITWSHQDAHAKAYATLTSPKSRAMAAKLGLPSASTAKVCLDCHADNVSQAQRGEKFSITDGIGCEACHGGAERWLTTHTSKRTSYRDNIAHGMYPTADLRERAALCLSCHSGTNDKLATHKIMAAGHPRLSFEMDTFLALQPPHYQVDDDYRRRKPTYTHTQVWAYGQLAAAVNELDLLQGRLNNSGTFPELALFNCYACHMSSMHRNDWGHRLLQIASEPGSVPINDGHLSMAWIIARQLEPASAPTLLHASQALIAASASGKQRIVDNARQVNALVTHLRDTAATRTWTRADQKQLLSTVIAVGTSGEFRDYIEAEQAVMGIDGLLIDMGIADHHRASLDQLYKLVQNDEAFVPEQFAAGLRRLQSEIDSRPE
jgi:hypothetical protein